MICFSDWPKEHTFLDNSNFIHFGNFKESKSMPFEVGDTKWL